jgi:hypothetical protein
MSNPFYDIYCHELNIGEHPFKSLSYKVEHITKKGGMFVTVISFSQPGFIELKMQ